MTDLGMSPYRSPPVGEPWLIERRENYQGQAHLVGAEILSADGGEIIAEVRGAIEIGGYPCAHNLAHARMIAAGPRMLALLRELDRQGGLGLAKHERIQAAIRLATEGA